RGVKVLEPAAATQVYDECIVVIGKLAKDLVSLFDDLCHVICSFLQVVVPVARHHDAVLLPLDRESDLFKITDLKWRVIKHIIVRGPKRVRLSLDRRQPCGHAPSAVRDDLYCRWCYDLVFYKKECCRIIPKRVLVIELVSP